MENWLSVNRTMMGVLSRLGLTARRRSGDGYLNEGAKRAQLLHMERTRQREQKGVVRLARPQAAADVAMVGLLPPPEWHPPVRRGQTQLFTREQLLMCLTGSGADAFAWLAELIGADDDEIEEATKRLDA